MKRYLLALAVGVVGSLLFGAVVFAQNEVRPETTTTDNVEVDARTQQLRERAMQKADEIRAKVSDQRTALRQEACRSQQVGVQNAITRIGGNVATLKDNFDTVYARLQAFYATGQSVVDNYDQLKASVDAAQANAVVAAEAVVSFEFELNCTDPDASQKLAGFRQAVADAKEALGAYKSTLLELVKVLRAGVQQQDAITDEEA